MKTRVVVYQIKNRKVEFVEIAGVLYGFNGSYLATDRQRDFREWYFQSDFSSVKKLKKYYGAANVRKVIKTGIADPREL